MNGKRRPGPPGRRDAQAWRARTERILDEAAAAVLAHGYAGTSIDRVATAAGVAKGTIYLHFPSRDALFTAVLRRERLLLVGDVHAARPAAAGVHEVLMHSARATQRRPLLRAVIGNDLDVLGRLAHAEPVTGLQGTARGFAAYLDALRADALIRTDVPTAELLAAVAAVLMGFLTMAPVLPAELSVTGERLPWLVADSANRLLDRGTPLTRAEADRASRITADYLTAAVTQAEAAYLLAAGLAEGAR
ncbi:helix-turn-helix domain-containing protein [Actinomycetes bacterium KLBMP 9759]